MSDVLKPKSTTKMMGVTKESHDAQQAELAAKDTLIRDLVTALKCAMDYDQLNEEDFVAKYDPDGKWVSMWDVLRDREEKALACAKEAGYA